MTPGTRLGAYEVVAQLGAGGMGEVYRARDLKLGRDVALKVLSASLGRTPDRLARFEREARLLAALNHQHIGAIYGIEEISSAAGQAAMPALILELVEGPTLADRMLPGRVPMRSSSAPSRPPSLDRLAPSMGARIDRRPSLPTGRAFDYTASFARRAWNAPRNPDS